MSLNACLTSRRIYTMFCRGQNVYSDSTISETDSSYESTPAECNQSSQLPFSAQNVSINFYSFSSAWNTMNFNQHPQSTMQISNPNIHCPALFDRQTSSEPPLPTLPLPSELPSYRPIHRNRRRKASKCQTWEIDDEVLPEVFLYSLL